MQQRAFRTGDLVFNGAIRGTLIGIYDNSKVLFFANEQRAGFKTRAEITNTKPGASKIIDYLIKEYFGYKYKPSHIILEQHRFKLLTLQDLHHMTKIQIIEEQNRLIRKRHLLIQMARSYMKSDKPDESIQRICGSIENVQAEIELEEDKKRHATGLATYE